MAIEWAGIFERYAARQAARLTENVRTVLAKRYLIKDGKGGAAEEPAEMFRRVAENVARGEGKFGEVVGGDGERNMAANSGRHGTREGVGKSEEEEAVGRAFEGLMASLDFLPNSPTLMNAGRKLQQLAACFVLPVEDSIEGIFESIKAAAIIHQSGGGTGFSFSRLRPRGDRVSTSDGEASGPVSFMQVFNEATRAISQGGFRRGANMGILRIDHPDIEEFIRAKETEGRLENFNLSVAVTEEFMRALAEDGAARLVNPRTGAVVREVAARELWKEIVERAWANGEPGLFFVDRTNADNPTPGLGPIESTNPCGEQPLLAYEACNLGSVNLGHFVAAGAVDYDGLRDAVHLGVRFLDDAIEMSRYPLAAIDEIVKGNRKIGLGVMGWADMLIELGIPYDSEEALALGRRVMGFVAEEALSASRDLAARRGAFPNFGRSVFAARGEAGRRNATVTTVAPTGTLSLIAGCSAGIEPIFAVVFERHVLGGEELLEVQPALERAARAGGFWTEDLVARLATEPLGAVAGVPEAVRRVFVTAHEVGAEWHVRMQAAFQEQVDNAVSKTVNLPAWATAAEVERIYRLAYELGCKGITIYRDQSRQEQVLVRHNGRRMVCRECGTGQGEACPDCGRALEHESGSEVCPECGYTRR